MIVPEPTDRRHFLASALAGAVLLALGSRTPLPSDVAPAPLTRAATRLARLFPRGQSAHRIGRLYLRQAPSEDDAPALVHLIVASLSVPLDALHRLDDGAMRELIERRVRQDFADGRTASVDGWVLSVTEARLCAVAALAGAT